MAEWSCRPSAVLTLCPSDQQEKLRIDTTHNNRAITIPIITSTRVLCLVSCISSSSPSTFRIGGVNVLPSLWRLIVMHRYKLKFDLILIVKCLHNFPPTKFGVCENCWSTLYQNQIFETIQFTVVSSGPAKPGIPADRQNRPQSCNVYCCRIITTGVNLIHCPYCPVATLRAPC